jgi:hypothetical protein
MALTAIDVLKHERVQMSDYDCIGKSRLFNEPKVVHVQHELTVQANQMQTLLVRLSEIGQREKHLGSVVVELDEPE